MSRFVLLRHDCPDGSWHYDWMIERQDPDRDPDRPLMTFRTTVGPTDARSFQAERIDDHRSVYLAFEGDLTGGRGSVTRIVGGEARLMVCKETEIRIDIEQPRLIHIRGRSCDGRVWAFVHVDHPASEGRLGKFDKSV